MAQRKTELSALPPRPLRLCGEGQFSLHSTLKLNHCPSICFLVAFNRDGYN
jgi:hypothetical protein